MANPRKGRKTGGLPQPAVDALAAGDLAARAQAIVDALPAQPVVTGADGALQFHPNGVIQALFASHPLELEALLEMDFPREDLAQFVQLLGMGCQAVADLGLLPAPPPQATEHPVHPFQPPVLDGFNRVCFRPNEVVRHLLKTGPLGLNDLVQREEATQPNWQQMAQLIGYSLDGFASLDAATDEACNWALAQWETRASRMAQVRSELLSQALDDALPAQDAHIGRTQGKPRL